MANLLANKRRRRLTIACVTVAAILALPKKAN